VGAALALPIPLFLGAQAARLWMSATRRHELIKKDRFGEPPKPTRESRVLPRVSRRGGRKVSELNVCFLPEPFRVFAKKLIQFIMRRRVFKTIEATMLGKIFRGPHEPAPSRASERTTHTNPPHSQCRELRHR
jgi:hypothetical protein